uniref:5'-nucleotidase domain-containing protein 3 n=2 Tax=Mesocestoides corti TaxID=53468 RepID=A0A5K3FB92_MESCO
MSKNILQCIGRFYQQSCRCLCKITPHFGHQGSSLPECLRQKNEVVEQEKSRLTEAEYFRRKYANMEELAKTLPAAQPVETDAVFVNKEVRLGELDVYGFDYDYTLVNYTNALAEFIFQETIGLLVWKWKYPQELLSVKYDPNFLIRGLHYDIKTGFIMKVDAFKNIQSGTVYKGLRPVPYEVVQSNYNGLYIPSALLRGSVHTKDHKITQMMDFFDLPASYAVCSAIEHFEQAGINYQPECIYGDVRNAVHTIHESGLLHRTIIKHPELYIKPNPLLRELLIHLASYGKSLFLISNSGASFINEGMNYVVGRDWRKFFDVIIVGANKPDFFRSNSSPFRAVDENGAFLSWEGVSKFESGQLYLGGSLDLLKQLTKWQLQRVLYFGDHVYSDLADASNQWGWATAAVIPELEKELTLINTSKYQDNLRRLILLEELLIENQYAVTAVGQSILASWRRERDTLRQFSKSGFNPHFGSVFRSFHKYSYFAQRLGLYASMYTSSVTNLLHLPINHVCYPRRTLLPHEPR